MSADEILKLLLDAMPDSYQKTVGFPTYDLLAAAALKIANTDAEVEAAKLKLNPENLKGSEFDRYIFPRTGLLRRAATFSTGVIHVTGNGIVNFGDLFESAGGVQFMVAEAVNVTGEADVKVTCMRDGTVGNLPAHTITQMPVTIQGISGCDNPEPTNEGYEEETDTSYYERHIIKVRTPPTSGNVYHYITWARETPGVGYAKVFPCARGENTVDVVLVGQDGRPATKALVEKVQEHIDPGSTGEGYGEAPIGARCFVSAAAAHPVTLRAKLLPVDVDAQEAAAEAVKQSVTAYLGSVALRQNYISYAQITAAVLSADGIKDFENLTIDGGTANVIIGEYECAVLGETEFTYG